MKKMETLLYVAMVLGGIIIYYFEYTPAPKDVTKRDFWRYGARNGIIGVSLIIAGSVCLFCEDHVYSYISKLNDFWSILVIIATLGAGFYFPWIVRIIKKRIIRSRKEFDRKE